MLAARTSPKCAAVAAPPGPAASQLWRQVVEPVEPFLDAVARALSDQVGSFDPEVAPYARYALTNQGKQLRPALVALSAQTVGDADPSVVTAAVIIEMVHLATLVHDDVMDEAAVRRQQPTLAVSWGNQTSVLLGDCLFAHALKLAATFPTTEVCRAVSSATKTVCSGEILQTLRRGQPATSRADYFRILRMKTAELFALSCDLGAWLGGADPDQRAALARFGLDLGTAYQVYDDCVDLFGSESAVGKSLGTDLASGKLTLPLLVVLERARPDERRQLHELLAHWDVRHTARLHALFRSHGALEESRRVIHEFLDAARRALDALPDTSSRAALAALTFFLAKQTDDLALAPQA